MIREAESEPSGDELLALIGALRAENASLKARIAELERRLGLNSSNSGKPPSSDGLRKPVRMKSLREGSGKQRGGQKGHTGETLRQVTDPDDVVDHYPSACSLCGAGLGPEASVGHSARQVFDLPKPQSPNIVRMIANAPPAARRRGRRFRTVSTRPFSTASESPPSWSICCISEALVNREFLPFLDTWNGFHRRRIAPLIAPAAVAKGRTIRRARE